MYNPYGFAFVLKTALVLCSCFVTINGNGAFSEPSMCIQLVAEEGIVSRDGSFVVRVQLNNTFDNPIPLEHLPRFTIDGVEMDDTNVSTHRGKFYAFARFAKDSNYMIASHLLPDESIEFELNLFDLEWNLEGSSILSNSRLRESLASGKYRLQADLEIGIDRRNQMPRLERIASNVVELVYVNGSDPNLEK